MYTHTYTCTHTYILYICTHTYIHVHIHINMYTHIWPSLLPECTHNKSAYIHLYTHMTEWASLRSSKTSQEHTCMCRRVYVCVYIHKLTYIHTHTNTGSYRHIWQSMPPEQAASCDRRVRGTNVCHTHTHIHICIYTLNTHIFIYTRTTHINICKHTHMHVWQRILLKQADRQADSSNRHVRVTSV